MKATQEEVQVTLGPSGQPRSFVRQGQSFWVSSVLDEWRYGGRWWLGEGPRLCLLVQAGTLTAELHQELLAPGRWWLARVQD